MSIKKYISKSNRKSALCILASGAMLLSLLTPVAVSADSLVMTVTGTELTEETLPEETLPSEEETEPSEETTPEESEPGTESSPVETLPEETRPAESKPASGNSEANLPTETLPSTAQPETSSPAETLPGETLPGETLPGETLPEVLASAPFTPQPPLDLGALEAGMPLNMSGIRKNLALKAYSLVGQVPYFWGGKYCALGWNPAWGQVMQVTTEGSPSTGTMRYFGLDCSGFVDWVYTNAFQSSYVVGQLGYVTKEQWENSYEISWDEAMVGDLVFRTTPYSGSMNHVGIIVDRDADGNVKIAHCSSAYNNVIVEDGRAGFPYVRRPYLMQKECGCTLEVDHRIIHSAVCKEYTGVNTTPGVKDRMVWESKEQLALDLRSMFPDPSFAEAVACALWNQYGQHEVSLWEQLLRENGADQELVNEVRVSMGMEADQKENTYLSLTACGFERLVDLVEEADIEVSWNFGTAKEQAVAALQTSFLPDLISDLASDNGLLENGQEHPPIVNIEGIQYLRAARSIDLGNNQISSLAPLDYTKNENYHWSYYYLENEVWKEDAEHLLHPDETLRLYFGGGIPGSDREYHTLLNLENNPITEAPEDLPGRIRLNHVVMVRETPESAAAE